MNTQHEGYVDLGVLLVDFWKGIKKFWYLLVVLSLLGMAAMMIYPKIGYVPLYASQATFTVKTVGNGTKNEVNTVYEFYYDQGTAEQIGATFPYILSSDVFNSRLKQELGTSYINGTVSASVIANSNLVTLKVVSADPDDSLEILNAVIAVYPDVAHYVIGDTHFEMINTPEQLENPVNVPNYRKSAAMGLLLGLCAGLGVVLVYALNKKTIRTELDMKQAISRPCLAALPETKHRPVIARARKDELNYAESMYSLQNRLDFLMKKDNHKVLMITSTIPSEGKTTLSLNLAIAMARRGMKVLLIDGDLRSPELGARIGTAQQHSMRDVLNGDVTLAEAAQYLEEFSLYFLGSRRKIQNPVAVIQSGKMKKLIAQARDFADIVIIDTPPCGMLADAGGYCEYADSVLMVVRQDWTNKNKVMDAVLDLPGRGDKLIGCVLNRVKTGFAYYGYGYHTYGYGYTKYGRYKGRYYGGKDTAEENRG